MFISCFKQAAVNTDNYFAADRKSPNMEFCFFLAAACDRSLISRAELRE